MCACVHAQKRPKGKAPPNPEGPEDALICDRVEHSTGKPSRSMAEPSVFVRSGSSCMSESARTPSPEPSVAFVFTGFDSPNTTQVPDAFFDLVAPQLSEAELRVALYIIRRTFGFKKDSDTISLRQMVEGITTKDGRVLDRGTGLKKSAVANALNGLERKGVILSRRNRSAERGNEPTTYALHIKDHPLSVPVDKGLSAYVDKGLSVPVDTQYTDRQQTALQHTVNSNSFELAAKLQKRSNFQNSKKRDKIE